MEGMNSESELVLYHSYLNCRPSREHCFEFVIMAKYAVTFGQENIRYQTPVA